MKKILVALLACLITSISLSAYAQVTFTSSSATSSGAQVVAGGTFSAGMNFAVGSAPKDTVTRVELREASTVLNSVTYTVTYLNGEIVNTNRSGTLVANLGIGSHQVFLRAISTGASSADTAPVTIVVSGPAPAPAPAPAPKVPVAALVSIIMSVLDSDAPVPPPAPAPGPTLVTPPPVNGGAVAIAPPSLTNPDAGTLPGSLSVTLGGAAAYGIDIAVPPGTAGVQPSISLSYNSQGTNGPVGLGWSLGGLSSIHRCGKTIAQDGVNGRIGFDNNDRLCLDGKRLVLINLSATDDAAYWSDTAEYRTEVDSFSRITAQLTNGVRSFKVESKDGRVMTYGHTASSSVKAIVGQVSSGTTAPQPQAKSGPLSWAIDQIVDRAGNYINFSYEQDGTTGEHRPTFIRYGGAGLPSHAAVKFVHEVRPDYWTRYVDEARNDLRSRVAHVQTYVGSNLDGDVVASGTIARDYALHYSQSPTSGRSLLDSMQGCARNPNTGAMDCLPATSFAWGKPDPAKQPGFVSKGFWQGAPILTTNGYIENQFLSKNHADYFSFNDFENHGFTDVLEKRVASPAVPYLGPTMASVQRKGDANPVPAGELRTQYRYFHNSGSGFTQYTYQISTGEPFAVLETADFDGDGAPDLLVSTPAGSRICLSPLGKGVPLGSPGSTITFACDSTRASVGGNSVYDLPYVVDLVGDGRSAVYSRIDDAGSKPTLLCVQGSCQADPYPPTAVLNYTYSQYGSPIVPEHTSVAFDQMIDFPGTGKPSDVRATTPYFLTQYTADDGSLVDVRRWYNLQPKVLITTFHLPTALPLPSLVAPYTYPAYTRTPPPYPTNQLSLGSKPYLFDRPDSGANLTADFNGSGYTSMAFGFIELGYSDTNNAYLYNRAEMTLCLSTGRALDCGVRKKLSGANYQAFHAIGNFVGDGQSTMLMEKMTLVPGGTPYPNGNFQMCRVTGDDTTGGTDVNDANLTCQAWTSPTITPSTSKYGPSDVVLYMDLLGNGRTQKVVYHSGGYTSDQYSTSNVWNEDGRWEVFAPVDIAVAGQALDRIYQVTNGVGAVSRVEYADALATGLVTQSGSSNFTYPQHLNGGVGKYVSRLHMSNGASAERSVSYAYQDSAIDVAGRGSLGFGIVKATDDQTGIQTSTSYAQVWPLTGMALSSTTATNNGQGVKLSVTANRLGTKNIAQANGTVTKFPFVAGSRVDRLDLDGSDLGTGSTSGVDAAGNDTADVQYDNWGNLTGSKSITTSLFARPGPSFTTKTVNTYLAPDTAHWLNSLLQRTAVTKMQSADSSSVTRTVDFSYEPNFSGRVKSEVHEAGDPTQTTTLTTTFDRSANPFGLVNSKTVSWLHPITRASLSATDRIVYDANGRFPVTVTNALNQSETHSNDPATGAAKTLTGPNQLTTTWTADGFGRVIKELRADGNESRQYQKQCANDCPPGAVMMAITDQFHGSDRISVPQLAYSDSAGHILRSQTWGFDGRAIVTDQHYDALGRVDDAYQPRYLSDAAYFATRQGYDILNRVTAVTTYDEGGAAHSANTQFNGLVSVLTNAKGQVRTDNHDVLGRVEQVRDAIGGITRFGYEPFGSLSNTIDPNGNVISVGYDRVGHKTDLRDPDLGWIHYDVDARGQTVQQISPKQRAAGQATRFDIDALGRMTARYENDLESHWVFDSATTGIGQLAEAYTGTPTTKDYRRVHTYDTLGRPSQSTQYLTDGVYLNKVDYDAYGRLIRQTNQRGTDAAKVFDSRYNGFGYLGRIDRGTLALWTVNAQDAQQRPSQIVLGNGLIKAQTYNSYSGRLDNDLLTTGSNVVRLQDIYTYDALGNVNTRNQLWDTSGFLETFGYDNLNRIINSTVSGMAQQGFTYDGAGNMLTKSGAGTYTYPAQGAGAVAPHGVQSTTQLGSFGYDANGNLVNGANRTISWTSFDMPLQITKTAPGTAAVNGQFVYGPEHQRVRQIRSDGSVVLYAGAQEIETKAGAVTVKTYWPGGVGVEIDRPGATTTELNWTHADRLGSPVAITGSDGALREKLAYDAWGKRRTIDGSATPDSLDGQIDNRGFTGHEMLDQLDLVHMNGRVYDPLTARFLSGDPFVTDPVNGQSYNRYSYVLNNPTNLIDPTGFADEARDPDKNCDSKCQDRKKEENQNGQNKSGESDSAGHSSKLGAGFGFGWAVVYSASNTEAGNNTKADTNGNVMPNGKNTSAAISGGIWNSINSGANLNGMQFASNDEGNIGRGAPGSGFAEPAGRSPIIQESFRTEAGASEGPLGGGEARNQAWQDNPNNVRTLKRAIDAEIKGGDRTYQTYTKTNPETGEVYTGRTSGKGTPEQNIARRDAGHHIKDYGPAALDKSSDSRGAIRGREQLMIEANGGAKSKGGTSGNAINGISPNNSGLQQYIDMARKAFGL